MFFGSVHSPIAVARRMCVACALGVAAAIAASSLVPALAQADQIDDVRAQIAEQLQELEQLQADTRDAQKQIDKLKSQMDDALAEIADEQKRYSQLADSMSDMAVELYKNRNDFSPLSILERSDSFSGALRRFDLREKALARYAEVTRETREACAELDQKYREVSERKDEQIQLEAQLREKGEKLTESIAELRKQEKLLSAEEQARLAQAAAAASQVAQTFETGTVGDDELEWQTGLASAYGGESDSMTPNPSPTATGTICDDWSVGVAVPMKWGPSKYYGRMVEISYGGRSIIAPVVDCGEMDHGRRALDLQPGVFKAFGCNTCDDWGVREVFYRFI